MSQINCAVLFGCCQSSPKYAQFQVLQSVQNLLGQRVSYNRIKPATHRLRRLQMNGRVPSPIKEKQEESLEQDMQLQALLQFSYCQLDLGYSWSQHEQRWPVLSRFGSE